MTAHFLNVPADEVGYEPSAVDAMIEIARSQFADPGSHVLEAAALRSAQFPLVKGGYRIDSVDAALDRLDDAFAQQEANRMLVRTGHQGSQERLGEISGVILGRTSRGRGKVFKRQPWWLKGYSVRQVDALIRQVARQLEGTSGSNVRLFRQATFQPAWGGYKEAQVDAFIDRVVQYLQIAKHLG